MSTEPKPISRSWRRFLRVSVRGLIVLVLVIGGWLGWIVRSANIQRNAVTAIKKVRGGVIYDFELRNGILNPQRKPWAPEWLVDLIGVDYFAHVTSVGIWLSSPETDAAIAMVGHLNRLEHLGLTASSVNDADLTHLKALSRLQYLDLSSSQVTGAGLVNLRGLTELTYLSLADTKVSDAGLAHLKGLTKLSYVGLARTQVTDSGVRELERALPKLTTYH